MTAFSKYKDFVNEPRKALNYLWQTVRDVEQATNTLKEAFFLVAVTLSKCRPGTPVPFTKDGVVYIAKLPKTARPGALFGMVFRPEGQPPTAGAPQPKVCHYPMPWCTHPLHLITNPESSAAIRHRSPCGR